MLKHHLFKSISNVLRIKTNKAPEAKWPEWIKGLNLAAKISWFVALRTFYNQGATAEEVLSISTTQLISEDRGTLRRASKEDWWQRIIYQLFIHNMHMFFLADSYNGWIIRVKYLHGVPPETLQYGWASRLSPVSLSCLVATFPVVQKHACMELQGLKKANKTLSEHMVIFHVQTSCFGNSSQTLYIWLERFSQLLCLQFHFFLLIILLWLHERRSKWLNWDIASSRG